MQPNVFMLTDPAHAVWFTSDTHYGHANIIKYSKRPFKDVPEMNEVLVENWNAKVGPYDLVIHLGDVAMGEIKTSLPYANRLNGVKVLIMGNHDRPYQGIRQTDEKRAQWIQTYKEAGFKDLYDHGFLEISGRRYFLNHIPYSGDMGASQDRTKYEKDKLLIPEDLGLPLICGHVHEAWTVHHSAKGTRMVNVGVDVHGFKPITLEEVLSLHN